MKKQLAHRIQRDTLDTHIQEEEVADNITSEMSEVCIQEYLKNLQSQFQL